MNNRNIKRCDVCGEILSDGEKENNECPHCNWYNNSLGEINETEVIFPNKVSLIKAKQLYKEGKSIEPDLDDFLEMLYFYSEAGFRYKDLDCCLFLVGETETKIEFGWSPENVYYFNDKQDFIDNAKIGNEYVKDIWDKVENPDYL